MPNSFVWGAISSVLVDPDQEAEDDAAAHGRTGTVFGSVIMKKRKISTSGEKRITRQ